MKTLQQEVIEFATKWGPRTQKRHGKFVDDLRLLMNNYAAEGIRVGIVPDAAYHNPCVKAVKEAGLEI